MFCLLSEILFLVSVIMVYATLLCVPRPSSAPLPPAPLLPPPPPPPHPTFRQWNNEWHEQLTRLQLWFEESYYALIWHILRWLGVEYEESGDQSVSDRDGVYAHELGKAHRYIFYRAPEMFPTFFCRGCWGQFQNNVNHLHVNFSFECGCC